MALSTQSATLVRQKTRMITRNPGIFYILKALFLHLATNKGNPDLQLLAFSEADADVAGGTNLVTGAGRIYAAYVKKLNSGTDNTFFVYDNATVDTTAGDAKIGLDLTAANEEAIAVYPDGLEFANGVLVTQYSDGIGATDGSDGGDGFIIIGA